MLYKNCSKVKLQKNTDKATKTLTTLLKTFCDQTNLNTDIEHISAMQLDRVLQRFYAGVRKPNGELYKPTTMNKFSFWISTIFLKSFGIRYHEGSRFVSLKHLL